MPCKLINRELQPTRRHTCTFCQWILDDTLAHDIPQATLVWTSGVVGVGCIQGERWCSLTTLFTCKFTSIRFIGGLFHLAIVRDRMGLNNQSVDTEFCHRYSIESKVRHCGSIEHMMVYCMEGSSWQVVYVIGSADLNVVYLTVDAWNGEGVRLSSASVTPLPRALPYLVKSGTWNWKEIQVNYGHVLCGKSTCWYKWTMTGELLDNGRKLTVQCAEEKIPPFILSPMYLFLLPSQAKFLFLHLKQNLRLKWKMLVNNTVATRTYIYR